MPSHRARLCRLLTKYLMASKFNSRKTVDDMRLEAERLTKWVRLPSNTHVESITLNSISAEWVCYGEPNNDRVVLYLHGGGYNVGSPNTHRELAAYLSLSSRARVLLPDYHLAPEHPFPKALNDATLTYRWLLTSGYSSDKIALAGDSAGGGLAIATAIDLRKKGHALPASIICISPWTDLSMSGESITSRAAIDPLLNLHIMQRMASNYLGTNDARNPLISPVYANLEGMPPLLIHVGSDEMLLDDATRLAAKAKQANVDVTIKIYPGMWHVWHLCTKRMPEAKNAIEALGTFICKHFVD